MFQKFQILKKALKQGKTLKTLKNSEKKLYTERKNFFNKKGLFYVNFFEFEVKTYSPVFGSI